MSEQIDVGAADSTYRLWKTKEAVRQGEMILASQMGNLQAAETRASSLLGWITAGLLAGLATFAAHPPAHEKIILLVLSVPALSGLALCVIALWPTKWNGQGVEPSAIIASTENSELSILEAIVWGQTEAIQGNYKRLAIFSRLMKAVWIAFIFVPIGACWAVIFLKVG